MSFNLEKPQSSFNLKSSQQVLAPLAANEEPPSTSCSASGSGKLFQSSFHNKQGSSFPVNHVIDPSHKLKFRGPPSKRNLIVSANGKEIQVENLLSVDLSPWLAHYDKLFADESVRKSKAQKSQTEENLATKSLEEKSTAPSAKPISASAPALGANQHKPACLWPYLTEKERANIRNWIPIPIKNTTSDNDEDAAVPVDSSLEQVVFQIVEISSDLATNNNEIPISSKHAAMAWEAKNSGDKEQADASDSPAKTMEHRKGSFQELLTKVSRHSKKTKLTKEDSNDLGRCLREMEERLESLGRRVDEVHKQVQAQKTEHLKLHNNIFKDSLNISEGLNL